MDSWNPQVVRCKAFVTFAGIVIKDQSRGSPISQNCLNVYASYCDRESFWDFVKLKGLLNLENLLIAGDLNFIVLETEVWGDSSRVDPLERYFTNLMLLSHLVDIALARLGPTWCNGLVGSVGIGKRLDKFLVAECMLPRLSQH